MMMNNMVEKKVDLLKKKIKKPEETTTKHLKMKDRLRIKNGFTRKSYVNHIEFNH